MKIATKRSLTTAFVIVIVGIIIAGIIMLTAPTAQKRSHEENRVRIETVTLKPQNINAIIETTGTTQTAQESTITAEVSGTVVYVNPTLDTQARCHHKKR
ncbi:MAG: hypothetical protein P8Y50_02805 [Sulfurovaceae bacterium]